MYTCIFYFLISFSLIILYTSCSPVHILRVHCTGIAYIWTLERGTPSRSVTGNFVSPGIESPATESAKLCLPVHVYLFMSYLPQQRAYDVVRTPIQLPQCEWHFPSITFVISSAFLNKKIIITKFDSLCGVEKIHFSEVQLQAKFNIKKTKYTTKNNISKMLQ